MSDAPALTLDNYHPFDPAQLACPHAGWALMRREKPVYPIDMPQAGVPVFLITKRRDIEYITSNTDKFSNKPVPAIWRWGDFKDSEIARLFGDAGFHIVQGLQTSDPPLAQQHRKMLDEAMTPRKVAALAPRIGAIIDRLIAGIPDGEPVNFVTAYSVPLPLLVIFMLLDIPEEKMDFFQLYTDEFAFLLDPVHPVERARKAAEVIVEGYKYFREQILRYRAKPADNLFSTIANARFDGGRVPGMDEVLAIVHNTIIAGNETTRNALSSAMLTFATRPDLWRKLKAEPARINDFTEELLRYTAPSNTTPRTALQDVVLSGVKVPKGACLFLLWGSGSTDEEEFPDPESFNIDRKNKRRHTSFGLGIRHCPGNFLARGEIRMSIQHWLDAFESVELAVPASEVHYEPIFGFHALGHLPLRLKRAKPAA